MEGAFRGRRNDSVLSPPEPAPDERQLCMAKTRFGIFGCGYMGRTRARAAAHLDSAWEVMLETVKRLGAPRPCHSDFTASNRLMANFRSHRLISSSSMPDRPFSDSTALSICSGVLAPIRTL